MEIRTKFDIREVVKINELKVDGKIISIHIRELGLTYTVRYFDNAEVKTVDFYEEELSNK